MSRDKARLHHTLGATYGDKSNRYHRSRSLNVTNDSDRVDILEQAKAIIKAREAAVAKIAAEMQATQQTVPSTTPTHTTPQTSEKPTAPAEKPVVKLSIPDKPLPPVPDMGDEAEETSPREKEHSRSNPEKQGTHKVVFSEPASPATRTKRRASFNFSGLMKKTSFSIHEPKEKEQTQTETQAKLSSPRGFLVSPKRKQQEGEDEDTTVKFKKRSRKSQRPERKSIPQLKVVKPTLHQSQFKILDLRSPKTEVYEVTFQFTTKNDEHRDWVISCHQADFDELHSQLHSQFSVAFAGYPKKATSDSILARLRRFLEGVMFLDFVLNSDLFLNFIQFPKEVTTH